jgi:hypothetical protein
MPLTAGKIALAQDLAAIYSDTGGMESVDIFAQKKARAILKFVLTGIPKTLITFVNPIAGTGVGGLDSIVPGSGLPSALPGLKAQYLKNWNHGGAVSAPIVFATKEAQAIFDYFSQTKVQTIDLGPLTPIAPPPAPPPLMGPSIGSGGTLTSLPGSGYQSALPGLVSAFKANWSQVATARSIEQCAQDESQAIHNFCVQGKVTTTGLIVSGHGPSLTSTLT